MDELTLLLNTPLFSGEEEGAKAAVERGEYRSFRKGEVVFSPTQFYPALGFVMAGTLEVTRGAMRMDTLGEGALFGAASLFDERGHYPTTITALTGSRVLFLRRDLAKELITRWPELAFRYIAYLSDRVSFLSDRVDALGAGRGADKLLCFIRDRGGMVTGLSGERLAATLGLSRATLYRAIDALSDQGLVVKEGKSLRLADIKKELPA